MAKATISFKYSPFLLVVMITPILLAAIVIYSTDFIEKKILTPYEKQQQALQINTLAQSQLALLDNDIHFIKNTIITASNHAANLDTQSYSVALNDIADSAIPPQSVELLDVDSETLTLASRAKLSNNIEGDLVSKTIDNNTLIIDNYALDKQSILVITSPITRRDNTVAAVIISRYDLALLSQTALNALPSTEVFSFSLNGKTLASSGDIDSTDNIVTFHSTLIPRLTLSVQLSRKTITDMRFDRGEISQIAYFLAALISVISLASYLIVRRYFAAQSKRELTLALHQAQLHGQLSPQASLDSAITQPLPQPNELYSTATPQRGPQHTESSANKQPPAKQPSPSVVQKDRVLCHEVDNIENSVASPAPAMINANLPAKRIFRAYDIRGHAENELDSTTVTQLGQAIGSAALKQSSYQIAVGCDGRLSSPRIKQDLINGLLSTGIDVLDIGSVATPLLYFTTYQSDYSSGVMITGSHNPSEYNGFKIVINQKALHSEQIQALYRSIEHSDFAEGEGHFSQGDIEEDYIDCIINDIAIAQPLKIVIDCGNGIAGKTAPKLFAALDCEVIPLYCEVDGHFPNHHPDPSVADNMRDLIAAVQEHQADIGIAFDGDGDRLGVVDQDGNLITADQLLMLFSQDILSRNPGADIVFDVKCTRQLNTLISAFGGRPIMWKSGHSLIKDKMHSTGALLGGEFTGHFFFKERWFGFDDGLYSGARLIEILSTEDMSLQDLLSAFPHAVGTAEIIVKVEEAIKFSIIEELIETANFGDGKRLTIDGLRVDYPQGWGLVRASNTSAAITLRFEANSQQAIEEIQDIFKQQLLSINHSVVVNF